MPRTLILFSMALLACLPAAAQSSSSYTLEEHTFNSGGHPEQGTTLASASYRISLDALGDALAARGLSGPSYRMDGGFVVAYPPPGPVLGLTFSSKTTLQWSPEPSTGDYNLYRDQLSALAGLGYGACLQQDLPGESATDAALPNSGAGFFYLVTAENRVGQEGTKGTDSFSTPRGGTTCP